MSNDLNYLHNNLRIIGEYENLYSEGVDIQKVIKVFDDGKLPLHSVVDYGRFRVFVDSCLLLFNGEKLSKYYKKQFTFKDFLDEVRRDRSLQSILDVIRGKRIFAWISGFELYYPKDSEEKNPWEQFVTVRNAMAHMQYGQFEFSIGGALIGYWIYNKDRGVLKNVGRVEEPILHDFIHRFCSNYSYGIPFKKNLFSCYSCKDRTITESIIYYEITCKGKEEVGYKGFQPNLLTEFAQSFSDEKQVLTFLDIHGEQLNIMERPVNTIEFLDEYTELARQLGLNSEAKYFCGLSTFLDFGSALSNFLVHLSYLNDVMYKYSMTRCEENVSTAKIEDIKKECQGELLGLKEDENESISFLLGFAYLKLMNFALRMEDDDFPKIEYDLVNVSMFKYDERNLQKYVKDNGIRSDKVQHYIIERIRNSVMHGCIDAAVRKRGEIIVLLVDEFNSRKEMIEVSLSDLNSFLSQPCLYCKVPHRTSIELLIPENGDGDRGAVYASICKMFEISH